ncbi:MAG: DUF1569 domain-containing protein [Chitinophagales bacterium]|nr:DUF1569 domain-containing protein [Chitinophagales bacterium]
MALPNVYDAAVAQQLIDRIHQLTPQTQPKWGKMDVARMLAHCNVTYEYVFDERNDQHNFLVKWLLRTFLKSTVTGEKPYKKNIGTAPSFIIADSKNFEQEKARLLEYIQRVVKQGAAYFEGKESSSFGAMTAAEWNNLMYKHIDHHLTQFGV